MLAPAHHVTRIPAPNILPSLERYKPEVKFIDNITVDEILTCVCSCLGEPVNAVKSRLRKHNLSEVRQVYIYFSRMLTSCTWTDIGASINRDHSDSIKHFHRINGLVQMQDEQILSKIKLAEAALINYLSEKV